MIVKGYRKGVPFDLEVELIDEHGHLLEVAAAGAFRRMAAAALLAGIRLMVNTAWRSYEEQRNLHDLFLAGMGAPANRPGTSTHQLGISVDVNRAPGDDPQTPGPDSPTDLWLAANARQYGFVRDVPAEPWHWTHDPDLTPTV